MQTSKFLIDVRSSTISIDSIEMRRCCGGECAIQFRGKNSLFHVAVLALVARAQEQNGSLKFVSIRNHAETIERFHSVLKRPMLDKYAAIYRFWKRQINPESRAIELRIAGRRASPEESAILKASLADLLEAEGNPDPKNLRLRFSTKTLHSLGLAAPDFRCSGLEELAASIKSVFANVSPAAEAVAGQNLAKQLQTVTEAGRLNSRANKRSNPKQEAQVVAEWTWEDYPSPRAVFVDDDLVVLGGQAASLSVIRFDSRKMLFRQAQDVELETKKAVETYRNSGRLGIKPIRSCVLTDPHPDMSDEQLANIFRRELQGRLRYKALEFSPDNLLLAARREDGTLPTFSFGAGEQIDLWDFLDPERPRLASHLPPCRNMDMQPKPWCIGSHSWAGFAGNASVFGFFQGDPRLRKELLCLANPRTSIALNSFELNPVFSQRFLRNYQVLCNRTTNELAMLYTVWNERKAQKQWQILDLGTGKMKKAQWDQSRHAMRIPNTEKVVFQSMTGERPTNQVEIWEWNAETASSRLTTVSVPNRLDASPDGNVLAVWSSTPESGQERSATVHARENRDWTLQAFSLPNNNEICRARLTSVNDVLATRVGRDQKIRVVTSRYRLLHGLLSCEVVFWSI